MCAAYKALHRIQASSDINLNHILSFRLQKFLSVNSQCNSEVCRKMFKIILISILASLSQSAELNSRSCGIMSSSSGLIQGGQLSARVEFPWIVAIFMRTESEYKHKGSGSLITAKHVLAKAYSVASKDEDKKYRVQESDKLKLFFGTIKYEELSEIGAIMIDDVEKVIVHPQAHEHSDGVFDISDIAVIFLKDEILFSDFIRPICLKSFGEAPVVGENVYGVGYGDDETGKPSGERKHLVMTILSEKRCKRFYDDELANAQESKFFCTLSKDISTPCTDDSPLYAKSDGKWYLRGMSSAAMTHPNGTCRSFNPILYEDISGFVQWIENVLML